MSPQCQIQMSTTRLLRTFNPVHSIKSSSSANALVLRCQLSKSSGVKNVEEIKVSGDGERRVTVVAKAVLVAASRGAVTLEPAVDGGLDVASLLAYVKNGVLVKTWKVATKKKAWKLRAQMLIEKGVVDCRFFTLFAVAGTLLGSVLCFLEGCFLIMESYLQYFHSLSHRSDQGHVMQLLIEAIDMFLVGTAMIIFGMGVYSMFVGSKNLRDERLLLLHSNFFGLFNLKTLPTWVETKSVSQAKSKIGHAVMMILQVGVLEKFNTVPLVTGLDLACFAGAVLLSSACIFVLSKLSIGGFTT